MIEAQMNVAVAEACGWTEVSARHRSGKAPNADYIGHEFLPDYCNDLNAMHEAEQTLKRMGQEYAQNLLEIVSRDAGIGAQYAHGSFAHLKATARQRAEAFLRTLGKWEETR